MTPEEIREIIVEQNEAHARALGYPNLISMQAELGAEQADGCGQPEEPPQCICCSEDRPNDLLMGVSNDPSKQHWMHQSCLKKLWEEWAASPFF